MVKRWTSGYSDDNGHFMEMVAASDYDALAAELALVGRGGANLIQERTEQYNVALSRIRELEQEIYGHVVMFQGMKDRITALEALVRKAGEIDPRFLEALEELGENQ